jgi:hypothetical protein
MQAKASVVLSWRKAVRAGAKQSAWHSSAVQTVGAAAEPMLRWTVPGFPCKLLCNATSAGVPLADRPSKRGSAWTRPRML